MKNRYPPRFLFFYLKQVNAIYLVRPFSIPRQRAIAQRKVSRLGDKPRFKTPSEKVIPLLKAVSFDYLKKEYSLLIREIRFFPYGGCYRIITIKERIAPTF